MTFPAFKQPQDNSAPLVIEPSRSWFRLDLGDLWSYRELFFFLAWRDIKVRYKQTLLGAAWAVDPAPADHDHLQRHLRSAGGPAFGGDSISRVHLYGVAALAIVYLCADAVVEQLGGQPESGQQSRLPASGHPDCFGGAGVGGLRRGRAAFLFTELPLIICLVRANLFTAHRPDTCTCCKCRCVLRESTRRAQSCSCFFSADSAISAVNILVADGSRVMKTCTKGIASVTTIF